MRAMTALVPMWIPTLIYGLGVAIMFVSMLRDWRKRDGEYQRGYDAGVADTIRSRISISSVLIGPASTEMTIRDWIEVDINDEPVH